MTHKPNHLLNRSTALFEPLEERRMMSAVPVAVRLVRGGATEGAGDSAVFMVSRAKALSEPTRVFFTVGGTAQKPVVSPTPDYLLNGMTVPDPTQPQLGTITTAGKAYVDIPKGAISTTVTFTPIDDSVADGTETATFEIVPTPNYKVSSTSSATLSIFDNDFRINFQSADSPVPSGYIPDTGQQFGLRAPGVSYGWESTIGANAVVRNNPFSPDARYDSFVKMQAGGNHKWEIALPNGTYMVRVVLGDPDTTDTIHGVGVEDNLGLFSRPVAGLPFRRLTGVVKVADGRLTVFNTLGSFNNKIDFIDIKSVARRSLLGQIALVSTTLKTPQNESFWHQQPNGLFSDDQIDEPLWADTTPNPGSGVSPASTGPTNATLTPRIFSQVRI
jgi:hypothetical protein